MKMMLDKLKSNYTYSGANNGTSITEELSKAVENVNDMFESTIVKVEGLKETDSGTGSGSQVKEVVRAVKNVTELKNKNAVEQLAKGFKSYLEAVLGAVNTVPTIGSAGPHVKNLCTELQALLDAVVKQSVDISSQITAVVKAKTTLHSNKGTGQQVGLIEGVTYGIDNLLTQLKKDGYKSSYDPTPKWPGDTDNNKMAQIFLGCLPLYYYWLTYLYWKCKHGGWAGQNFTRPDLKHFMVGQGYNSSHLTTTRGFNGSSIASMIEALGMSTVATSAQHSHTDLLSALDNSLQGVIGSSTTNISTRFNGHSLSALFYLCHCYFTGKHIMQSKLPDLKPRRPTSIREMLYWLSGLRFSPHYSSIEQQIDGHIPSGGLRVADSSIPSTSNSSGDTLTQSQMKGFLLSSCLSAPGVLGAIQGDSADTDEGEPWLYSLFCNSMKLQYPSGSALFNTLSNYAYALQFQLLFLYQQCRTNHNQSYGWQWCRYGQSAQPSGSNSEELASWICKAPDCGLGHGCQHNSSSCEHIKECGIQGKSSPLQAFLTDNLKSFHVSQKPDPESLNHLDNHPSGSMCHTPMGFASALSKDPNATGWYIYYLLDHFCGGSKTPLRQLCAKLSCLTKRTPRTLGDLFGFMWHLNGQLFKQRPTPQSMAEMLVKALGPNKPPKVPAFIVDILKKIGGPASGNGPPSGLSQSLEAMAPAIPFLYQMFTGDPKDFLPTVLFDLKGTTHKGIPSYTGPHNNLYSLQNPGCSEPNCGTYLSPLCYSNGSAFAPKHASSYFSWVLYLVDDLETGLRDMLDEFTNIDCKKSGCHEQKCQSEHSSGQHGSSDTQCQCESVVQCGGVLPILYSNGFNFASAGFLKNGGGQSSGKKTCHQFHSQLTVVLAQNNTTPLFKLLNTIDEFLYLFRFYFFYNLSSFWIMYVCIVLYIYFLRTDLLHLKSHVHFPSSHGIPPITLLTTGKSPSITKLTYFTTDLI